MEQDANYENDFEEEEKEEVEEKADLFANNAWQVNNEVPVEENKDSEDEEISSQIDLI